MRFLTAVFLLTFITFFSCQHKNEVDLHPCDSTNVSYAKHIEPIIRNNCYKCHGNDAAAQFALPTYPHATPVYLEGYDSLKKNTQYNNVIGNVRHLSGYQAMPKGEPMLPACDIAKIAHWIYVQHAPNN